MDTLLACKAEAATANNVLIFNALQLLVRDSMRLYQVMTMVVSRLIGACLCASAVHRACERGPIRTPCST